MIVTRLNTIRKSDQCWNGDGRSITDSENQISVRAIKRGARDELLASFPKDSSISRQIQRKSTSLTYKQ
uniref:Uncharacterized protein n=1 Tax=Ditylenchus dipsaci TaxID=166011 RepID=A0A915DF72_9BILA